MSSALLKRSTEILQEDLTSIDKKSNASKSANKSERVSQLKLHKDRVFKLKSDKNSKATRRQCVHDWKQTLDGNKLRNENITKLLSLSQNSVQIAAAEKIVKRAHKGRYSEVAIPKVQLESVFTEEDFQAFEKEYLC